VPGAAFNQLADLAADQYGFVSQHDARELGIQPMTLIRMAERGTLERRGHGLYRLRYFPVSPLDSYMEATLWPRGVRGVLSHETALQLYELSDVNPSKIHITVPPGHRIRREIPTLYRVHHEALADGAITFTGQEPFAADELTIAADTLVEAGIDPSLEGLVTGYVETRLLAAGYGISPWDERPPAAVGGWTLRG